MTREELQQLITDVQKRQSELANVEVKAARSGTPRRLYESISAFGNRTGGGVLLFGIDESSDFSIVGVGDAQRLQEDITHLASSEMEPALRPSFLVDEIDDGTVVAVEIDEIPAAQKPCFYEPAGLPKGAYLRVGNTNRQMTEYEVFGYLSSRGQPTYDEEVIANATIRDLDNRLLDEYLPILRQTRPGAGFLGGERDEVLMRLHAVAQDGEIMRPTLAGLLMFGKYPQEFLPQLMVTFVQYFGTTEEECTPHGARFVDSRRFEGPIPEMVKQAETYVRGSYIQIRMFADRLEIQSPGCLFGNVTVENLEEEHSTRNARLMRMMEDMHVVENRGSGIRAMLQAMREANLEPPRFDPPGIVAAEFGLLAISGFWRHGCWGFFAQPSALATSSSTPMIWRERCATLGSRLSVGSIRPWRRNA